MNKVDTIAVIRSLLSSTKCTYNIFRLNRDFKNETGLDIPLFGYANLSDFLHSIPDTVKVSGIYPIEQVSLVENKKSAHILSLVNRTKNSNHRKHTAKNQFRKHIIYKRNSKIQNYPEIVEVRNSEMVNGESYDTKSSRGNCDITSLCSSEVKSEQLIQGQISFHNFMDNADSIPPIDIKPHAQVGEYIEVCLKHISNPHEFYFHFRKFKKKFAALMDKMQKFYEKEQKIPQVTERGIKPKQIFAVYHKIHDQPLWHRGEVNEIISKGHVRVTFIDYGCSAKIWKGNLKFLHKNFASLPKQAILGFLANIKPSKMEPEWSTNATNRFIDLAFQKELIAGVVSVDAEACSMQLALSSTKGLEIHINDTLVKEGYAEFESYILNNNAEKSSEPLYKKSWERKLGEAIILKTDVTEENILKAIENPLSSRPGTPFYYFSIAFSDNKRLQKLFSSDEGK